MYFHSLGVTILDTLHIIMSLLKQQQKTQKDLTDFLGIQKNAFSNWKSGNNTSYMKYLPRIADYLNVSVNYLLGKEEKTLDEQLEGVEFALWGEVKEMTDGQKQDVLDYIRFKKSKE